MKVFWKDGALNLKPETEEDGKVTSAILFAFGTEKAELQFHSDAVSGDTDHNFLLSLQTKCVSS